MSQPTPNAATKFTGGPLRTTYCFVHKPKPTKRLDKQGNIVSLYSSAFLLPKNDPASAAVLAQMQACVEAAKLEGARAFWGGSIPPGLKLPIRDGDSQMDKKSADPVYNGHWFLNATAGKKPGLIYANGQPILDENELQSGYWVIADLNFYPFKVDGNDGVAVGVNNLMLHRKDTVLGGSAPPEQAFASFINKSGGGDAPAATGGFGQSTGFGGNPGGFL